MRLLQSQERRIAPFRTAVVVGIASVLAVVGSLTPTVACPLCSSIGLTLTEEMADVDAVVIVKLVGPATPVSIQPPALPEPSAPSDPAATEPTVPTTAVAPGASPSEAPGQTPRSTDGGVELSGPPSIPPFVGGLPMRGLPGDGDEEGFDALPMTEFEIIEVLKGQEDFPKQRSAWPKVKALYFGDAKPGATFMVTGVGVPAFSWSTPMPVTEEGIAYLKTLPTLATEGPERMAFFLNNLGSSSDMLRRDAYDEFARAPYSDLVALKDQLPHEQLVKWIHDPDVTTPHRRLYLMMVGICGSDADLPWLADLLRSDSADAKSALDPLIACYLTLKGESGVDLIEELFIKDKKAEYADTYAAVQALRFHGTEADIVPRDRIKQAFHLMLDRPPLADLVIPDLARWEDWTVMPKLVELFKTADEESQWVRLPVVNYLRRCPLPEAKVAIEELRKIDPEAVSQASSILFSLLDDEEDEEVPADEEKSADAEADDATMAPEPDAATPPPVPTDIPTPPVTPEGPITPVQPSPVAVPAASSGAQAGPASTDRVDAAGDWPSEPALMSGLAMGTTGLLAARPNRDRQTAESSQANEPSDLTGPTAISWKPPADRATPAEDDPSDETDPTTPVSAESDPADQADAIVSDSRQYSVAERLRMSERQTRASRGDSASRKASLARSAVSAPSEEETPLGVGGPWIILGVLGLVIPLFFVQWAILTRRGG